MSVIERYRGYDITQDDRGISYHRPGKINRWYFPSIEDARYDIDLYLDY